MSMMFKVVQIFIYPIKGLKGISVSSSRVLQEGLEHDRRWMLIDDTGSFISQRTDPEMTQFATTIIGDDITVKHQSKNFRFSLYENLDPILSARVWEHEVDVQEVSQEGSIWFSEILNKSVKLVKQKQGAVRIKEYSDREGSTLVSFADGYPMLVLGTASVDMLNDKLDNPINGDRFRANIIVNTTIPHEEDTWSSLNIGSSQIEVIKPCARCQVVNIDQSTGKSTNEILKTISTYRRRDNKVYFGANASCLKSGVISVGDQF